MMRAFLLGFAFLVAGSTQGAPSAGPMVASSHLRGGGTAGNVFFLPSAHSTVAVGAAHSFDRTQLAESVEVSFRTASGGATIGRSRRFFAAPGARLSRTGGDASR